MGLFNKQPVEPLAVDFEAALDKASRARWGVAKSQAFIRGRLLASEKIRFIMVEDYVGTYTVVVTDLRLLVFKNSGGGQCRELTHVCGREAIQDVEVVINPQSRSSYAVIHAENFRLTLKTMYSGTGKALSHAVQEMSASGAGRLPAPTLPPEFFSSMLLAAGFPVTEHNLFAVTERIGSMFLGTARKYVTEFGTAQQNAQFETTFALVPEVGLWPQAILDQLVAWVPASAVLIQDLPARMRAMLLDSAGQEGRFFGPNRSAPLPTMAEW